MSENQIFIFNNEEITFKHSIFDVVVFDHENQVVKETFTKEEELEAKNALAQYMLDAGQITLPQEKNREAKKVK